MSKEFDLSGMRELDNAFGELKKSTAKGVMRRALIKSAKPMVDAARQKAPVDKGNLRDSYHASARATGKKAFGGAFAAARRSGSSVADARVAGIAAAREAGIGDSFAEVYIGSTSKLAHLQEFGTGHHAAQPHFRPAVDQTTSAVAEKIAENLELELNKTLARIAAKAAKMGKG